MTTIPPNSKESEMMVLGCMLESINNLNVGSDALHDSDFYYTEHQIIFRVLKTRYKEDKPADIHIVCEELTRLNKLSEIGGLGYLVSLAQYAGTSAYIEEYAQIVKGKSILRKIVDACQVSQKDALGEPHDVLGCLDKAQQLFFKISQSANPSAGISLKDLISGVKSKSQLPFVTEFEQRREKFKQSGGKTAEITGIPSGYIDIDKKLSGLNNSNLMILAARPAMGKTALAMNIAENICLNLNIPVGIFSLEMNAEQILHRIVSSQSKVDATKIKAGSVTDQEYQRVIDCAERLQAAPIWIDDQGSITITDLRARARRMKESHNIGFLVIDYLQLISPSSGRSNENRQNEVAEISRMLKNVARELDIPILCLSQLSRKVEERSGHRPVMSDLRESGSIEQDADIVMFLLRRDYYDPNDRPGEVELIIAKNRHGDVGNIFLTYRKEIVRFENHIPIKYTPQEVEDSFAPFRPSYN